MTGAASPTPNGVVADIQNVVKMKGLPFKASVEDVTKFFSGLPLKSERVYLKRHPDGRPNGEAFVVFDNSDDARKATQKDRETFGDKFGDRYVRVYPTLESDAPDMQAAMSQQAMGNGHSHVHSDSVVKMKSLPFDATQLDIIQFFESFKLKPNGVQLVVRSDNKPTGEAFVDFENSEEAARAIREKDHKVFSEKFGDRYVRLIQVSRKEMQATLALRFGGEGILKVKGIPFKATALDVRKFFSGYKIKPDGVSFIMHADGRPTGMAFIEFETPQEAVRAMEKDRAKFGPEYGERFCMLQLVGRHEMDKVTLQRESEQLSKLHNPLTTQQITALALQAAFSQPLQPLMLPGANPWLPLGLTPQAALSSQLAQVSAAAAANPLLDSSLAAAGAFSAQLNAANGSLSGMNGMGIGTAGLGLNVLQQSNALHANDIPPGWIANIDPATGLMVYQNPATGERQFADSRFNYGNVHGSAAASSLAPGFVGLSQPPQNLQLTPQSLSLPHPNTGGMSALQISPLLRSSAKVAGAVQTSIALPQLSACLPTIPLPIPNGRAADHVNGYQPVGSVGSISNSLTGDRGIIAE